MKKMLAVLAIVLALGAVFLAGLRPWGFSLGGVEFAWSPEYQEVERLGRQFMEDIEFKDWDRAASYHTWAEKQEADIPEQIRKLFGIKPEQLHIENVRLMGVDMSEDGLRARTRFKAHVEVLNSAQSEEEENKNRDMEINLYWQRRPVGEALPPEEEAPPAASQDPPTAEGQPAGAGDAAPEGGDVAAAEGSEPPADGAQPAEPAPEPQGESRWFLYLRDSLEDLQPAIPR